MTIDKEKKETDHLRILKILKDEAQNSPNFFYSKCMEIGDGDLPRYRFALLGVKELKYFWVFSLQTVFFLFLAGGGGGGVEGD